jgi:hypothetical protein
MQPAADRAARRQVVDGQGRQESGLFAGRDDLRQPASGDGRRDAGRELAAGDSH